MFEYLVRAAPQSDEIDVHVIQLVEIRESTAAAADRFSPSFLDFIILLFLAQITVRVAKHPSLGILRYEGQHALLLAATL